VRRPSAQLTKEDPLKELQTTSVNPSNHTSVDDGQISLDGLGSCGCLSGALLIQNILDSKQCKKEFELKEGIEHLIKLRYGQKHTWNRTVRAYPKSDPVMHGQMFVHSDVFEVSPEETSVYLGVSFLQ
jgi:hypothetical protein